MPTQPNIDTMSDRNHDMEDLRKRIDTVYRAIFGDPENTHGTPGIIAEIERMDSRIKTTNEILTDLRTDIKKLGFMFAAGIITAIMAMILKH